MKQSFSSFNIFRKKSSNPHVQDGKEKASSEKANDQDKKDAPNHLLGETYYKDAQDHLRKGNIEEAEKQARNAIAQGNGYAQDLLGTIYYDSSKLTKALEWYEQDTTNVAAMVALGNMYLDGKGTTSNPNDALKYYNKAFAWADPRAAYGIGKISLHTERDTKKACKYFKIAASEPNGYYLAQYELGMMVLKGHHGEDPNPQEALEWFCKSADKGYAPAQIEEIRLYSALLSKALPDTATLENIISRCDKHLKTCKEPLAKQQIAEEINKLPLDQLLSPQVPTNDSQEAKQSPVQTITSSKINEKRTSVKDMRFPKNPLVSPERTKHHSSDSFRALTLSPDENKLTSSPSFLRKKSDSMSHFK